jgi:hypothetical protein
MFGVRYSVLANRYSSPFRRDAMQSAAASGLPVLRLACAQARLL